MKARRTKAHFEQDIAEWREGDDRKNAVDVQVGSRIRMRRTRLGYSVAQLGEAIGVTEEQLTKWESGVGRVGAEGLQAISQFLQESPTAFFEDFDFDPMIASMNRARVERNCASNQSTSIENLDLIQAFSRIGDAGDRKKVVALAVALAENAKLGN